MLGWILASIRFYAYLNDVTSPNGLQVNLGHSRAKECLPGARLDNWREIHLA